MSDGRRRRRLKHEPPARRERRRGRRPVLFVLALIAAIAAIYLLRRPRPKPPVLAAIGQVQSAVTQEGDSLQVVVHWQLAAPSARARADSLRVEVRVDSAGGTASRVRIHSNIRQQDTLYVPAPHPGEATDGLSCVAAQQRSVLSLETCTAWRYVRPLASVPAPTLRQRQAHGARAAAADEPIRIVIQPSGLQVDPDVGGRCAEWQRRHPAAPVWIEVNRIAVPPCTGPNRRPTVAQFCAFAELADGRRVKTANAENNPYCDRLFRQWERERIS